MFFFHTTCLNAIFDSEFIFLITPGASLFINLLIFFFFSQKFKENKRKERKERKERKKSLLTKYFTILQ